MITDLNPLVSVIIPFFNREELTLISIQSVLDQSFRDFEIILVDDGSTESIDKIIGLDNPRIILLHQSNQGPAAARNLGIRHSRGKYIAFLDSDDIFLPDKLTHQVGVHETNPQIWFSHTSYQKIDQAGNILGVTHSGIFTGCVFPDILVYCPIATPTVMINRKVLEQSIFYDEQYKISEDVIFYSKIARHSEIIGIDIPLSCVRVSEKSHSTNSNSQISGYNNILKFIGNKTLNLSEEQYQEVNYKIYNFLALHYYLEGKVENFIKFIGHSCYAIYFSKQKIQTIIVYLKMILMAFGTKLGLIKKSNKS